MIDANSGPGVVILGYRDATPAIDIARRLVNEGADPDAVLVVVNASPPLEDESPVPLVTLARNTGYPAGMNLGIARLAAHGHTRVALITHDVHISWSDVQGLARTLAERSLCVAVGPVLRHPDGRVQSAGGLVAMGRALHRTSVPPEAEAVDWLDGAVLVVDVSAMTAIGGFDERLFLYSEDLDLGLRARAAAYACVIDPAHSAVHDRGSTTATRRAAYNFLVVRNNLVVLGRSLGMAQRVWVALRTVRDILRRGAPMRRFTLIGLVHGLLGCHGPPPRSVLHASDVVYP